MAIQSVNPATGDLLRTFQALAPDMLETKLTLADEASRTYPQEALGQRRFWMKRLALLLEADADELAEVMTAEMGKTLSAAKSEVLKCASVCRFYSEQAETMLSQQTIETEHAASYVRYEPLGVVLAIMPWNFPLWQVFRFLAPALMAGNVGLLKHAANVPQCALLIEALTRRAGFPRGVLQTLLLEMDQVETVIADERVAAVTVTGSEAAGRAVAAQAGWLLKKSVLELGGSDPFIVMPSADFDLAVSTAVKARCLNNGQSCIAAKRFLVHDDIYERFETAFVDAMAAVQVGDPMESDTEVGPLATSRQMENLLAQIEAARAAGGRVLTGGSRISVEGHELGYFVQPTVIAGVPRDAAIAKQETFGPLAMLFRVSSLDDAIALANDTPFGLAASVWTRDAGEEQAFVNKLQCGGVFVNAMVASDPRLPFGGIKHSGYGRELAAEGMREFLNAKTVVAAGSGTEAKPEQSSLFVASESGMHFVATPEAASGKSRVSSVKQMPAAEPRRHDSILGSTLR